MVQDFLGDGPPTSGCRTGLGGQVGWGGQGSPVLPGHLPRDVQYAIDGDDTVLAPGFSICSPKSAPSAGGGTN